MSEDIIAEPAKAPSKVAILTKLLSRPRGALLSELSAAAGWQAHSVRAFLTGLRKKGVSLVREQRRDGGTAYRIVKPVQTMPVSGGPVDA